jgi:hypothetical protein
LPVTGTAAVAPSVALGVVVSDPVPLLTAVEVDSTLAVDVEIISVSTGLVAGALVAAGLAGVAFPAQALSSIIVSTITEKTMFIFLIRSYSFHLLTLSMDCSHELTYETKDSPSLKINNGG